MTLATLRGSDTRFKGLAAFNGVMEEEMTKYWMALAAATMFSFGCVDKGGDTGGEEADADTDADTDADPTFAVSWGASSLTATATDFDGAFFGMAEDNASCNSADSEYGCYTGEDCAYGYDNPVTGSTFGPYCHPLSSGTVTLTYSGSCEVTEGSETCFPNDGYSGLTAYYFEAADGSCYTGGTNPDYWSGFGCTSTSVPD